MSTLRVRSVATLMVCALASPTVWPSTIDFSAGLSNGATIPETLGDLTGLDVSYRSLVDWGNSSTTANPDLRYWPSNYSGLVDIAYAGERTVGIGEITFAPSAPHELTLSDLQLGSNYSRVRNTQVRIYSADYSSILFDSGVLTVGASPLTVSPNLVTGDLVHLQFGTGYNIGIDNINYTLAAVPPASVPLPAPLLLLPSALAGLAMCRRRKG